MNEEYQDKNGSHFSRDGEGRKPREGYQGYRDGRSSFGSGKAYPRRNPRNEGYYGNNSRSEEYERPQYRRFSPNTSGGGDKPRYGEGGFRSYGGREYGQYREGGNYRASHYDNRRNGNGYQGGAHHNSDGNARPGGERFGSADRPYANRRPAFNRGGEHENGAPHYDNGGSAYGYKSQRAFKPYTKYSNKKRLAYKEKNIDPNEPIRLNKYLANAGVCSRRDADKYIAAGVVTVNGNVVTELGSKVLRSDTVMFHDTPVKIEKKVYVLLNKPKGYVTTSEDPQNRRIVMDLVKDACSERIYPVGRLDRNTTGVLLLTNDGELASKLTHPKYLKKKIYHVQTDRNVSAGDLQQIVSGITLEDGEIKADAAAYASDTDKKQVGIEIHSGKNRIVRRIFEHLGYHVLKLDRVYFAGLTKKGLRRGDWRFLTEKEVAMLRMGAFE